MKANGSPLTYVGSCSLTNSFPSPHNCDAAFDGDATTDSAGTQGTRWGTTGSAPNCAFFSTTGMADTIEVSPS